MFLYLHCFESAARLHLLSTVINLQLIKILHVALEDVFTAELTVGSNVTLEANSILLALNDADVEVNAQKVILIRSEVVAGMKLFPLSFIIIPNGSSLRQ